MAVLNEHDAIMQKITGSETVSGEFLNDALSCFHKNIIGKPEVNNWIPCSERMPNKDGDYLCISNQEIKILPYRNGEFYGICFDGVLRCCNSSVTHWMPIPEPPKGESK